MRLLFVKLRRRTVRTLITVAGIWTFISTLCVGRSQVVRASEKLRAVLLAPAQLTTTQLLHFKNSKFNSVVLYLSEEDSVQATRAATERVRSAGMDLYYWIEIGRNPTLADAHPEWMASLQGHPEWRRRFPNLRPAAQGEVVKNYPWVPVFYREAFDAHLRRVARLLSKHPTPKGILLNDLQGAPSACGCGNRLCRWTADYGPIQTATLLPHDAAAKFVTEVQRVAPAAKIIPVWTTECEEEDKQGECAGVGCFSGACWREWTKQLMPLAERTESVAVLLTYKALNRDLPRYVTVSGWVTRALAAFGEMTTKREGRAISAARLIAVLQGWEVTEEEQRAQIARSEESNTAGYILALTKIAQDWEPRIVKLR
jgi:hypothetical protein